MSAETTTTTEQVERVAAWMNSLLDAKQTWAVGTRGWKPEDPVEKARRYYVSGAIDLETFASRLDVAFGLA